MVGDGRDGRLIDVNKGDLPDSARGLRGTSGTGSGHTQPTRPAVRVGAVRRYERADATPVQPVPVGVRAPLARVTEFLTQRVIAWADTRRKRMTYGEW